MLLLRYLMNAWNNFYETDREYSLAPNDDLIRFCRSNVKVTAGRRGGEDIHVDSTLRRDVEVHLLVRLRIHSVNERLKIVADWTSFHENIFHLFFGSIHTHLVYFIQPVKSFRCN